VIDPIANGSSPAAPGTAAVGPDGTLYFGLGNMYQPATVALRSPGRRLYADSTVALDGKTGKLKWFYQAVPDDFHDWDMQLSPIYTKRNGRGIVLDAGKMGYVYAIDAKTGGSSGRPGWASTTATTPTASWRCDTRSGFAFRSRSNPESSAASRPTWRSPTGRLRPGGQPGVALEREVRAREG